MSTKALPQLPERIPLPPYPNGWFSVCFSEELQVAQVKRIQAFGREIALFRGEDGVAHALDAYCAHLGAHLAVGGKVCGNRLVCPFHAWEYDGEGSCVHIPYSNKIPPRAKQAKYALHEVNGYIALWHHAENSAPTYEVPVIPEVTDPKFRLFKENTWEVHTHLQEVFENAIDIPHFVVVHGMNVQRSHFETDGPFGALELDIKRDDNDAQAQVDEHQQSQIRSFVWGPGLSLTRVSGWMKGVSVQTLTPVDLEKIVIRHRYYVGDEAPQDKMHEFFDFYAQDWVRDFDIWNRKKYRAVPNLAEGDGDVNKFRRWYAQFYSQSVETAAE
jgi:nitrite reductase/ring-hydroxylating ferredoxin subunit